MTKLMSDLLDEINRAVCETPCLWWLGQSGFAIKYRGMVFYIDVCPSPSLDPGAINNADLILCTHPRAGHMDPLALPAMLKASPRARVVLPDNAIGRAHAIGVPYERMTTAQAGSMRVEYSKDGEHVHVYPVPCESPEGLGYVLRFGDCVIYHAGDGRGFGGMAARLRPYRITVALLPIHGNSNFDIAGAAQLAEDIGARWLVPLLEKVNVDSFVNHMLGQRPSIGFKIFEVGEGWTAPV